MDKQAVADKMDDVVRGMRENLARHDAWTGNNIANSFTMGYEELKAYVTDDDGAKHLLDQMSKIRDDFSEAYEHRDLYRANALLDKADDVIARFRSMH